MEKSTETTIPNGVLPYLPWMKMMSEEDALETNVSEILDSPETTTLPLFEGQFQWNKASSLKTPLSENLTQKHPRTPQMSSGRRRPNTTVRALASSLLAGKYDQLMDKRLAIADLEKQKLENDLKFQKEEQALKLELLKLQIINEKKRL
ncbi:uncharacterized protein LOC125503486 isoform X2 [Dendroctonus ponderosae]|uniref:uncharacterized protein LOC125503486 isoform X2 n=1 Tax=Dendroctonus ponderosae TaxID=77166 RepID=UPI002034D5AD|nr:uncharacterized protein LOC125503486 isoform X2 [Dendroctonus ponderosae]